MYADSTHVIGRNTERHASTVEQRRDHLPLVGGQDQRDQRIRDEPEADREREDDQRQQRGRALERARPALGRQLGHRRHQHERDLLADLDRRDVGEVVGHVVRAGRAGAEEVARSRGCPSSARPACAMPWTPSGTPNFSMSLKRDHVQRRRRRPAREAGGADQDRDDDAATGRCSRSTIDQPPQPSAASESAVTGVDELADRERDARRAEVHAAASARARASRRAGGCRPRAPCPGRTPRRRGASRNGVRRPPNSAISPSAIAPSTT